MRKIIFSLSLICIYVLFSSHEFWLQPDKFIYQRGEQINMRFYVGEHFEGVNWKGNRSKINSLKIYYSGVSDNMAGQISGQEGDSLQFHVYDEGNVLVAFNSTNSFIELEAEKFNAYLEEDGLTKTLAYRKDHNQEDQPGREYYQRCSKTLLQVGELYTSTYRVSTSLPLDIIPLVNPYLLKSNDSLKAKILFNKQPLAQQSVSIWHRDNGKTEKQELLTNDKGEIAFTVTPTGMWMISTVSMTRLENDPKADWQSYWGSFVWGYQ